MEIAVFPRSFAIAPVVSSSAEGPVPAMRVTVQDVSGTVVHVTFALGDFEAFQRAVADHEKFGAEMREAAKAAEARQRIVLAGTPLGPPTSKRKH